jgi:GMP synthase (glutamine-hydrolysing)
LQARHREVGPTDADADLVVVLGGTMGVYEAEQHPWLGAEQALLRTRLAQGRPCLGLCLGAQLLAAAAGVPVARGTNGLEVGALPVQWTAAGRRDPVTGPTAQATELVVAQWHQDTFPLPGGAVQLAASPQYAQQAFRLGRSYGFQFHLEVTPHSFAVWLRGGASELRAAGHDPQVVQATLPALAAAAAAHAALRQRLAEQLAAWARLAT